MLPNSGAPDDGTTCSENQEQFENQIRAPILGSSATVFRSTAVRDTAGVLPEIGAYMLRFVVAHLGTTCYGFREHFENQTGAPIFSSTTAAPSIVTRG